MTAIHQLHIGQLTLPQNHPRSADMTCDIYSYAIAHPDGVIVVDTGPREGHAFIDELYAPDVITIIEALNRVDIDERDVRAVVNTHLHFDHCGQNHLLPDSPVWITQAEHEVSTSEFYTVPEWAHIESDRRRFSADGENLTDGIRLLHTPGHTPGHQSVAVETGYGLEIIVGQTCYTCAEYEASRIDEPDMHDPTWLTAGVESLARLQALEAIRAHFSHDSTTYALN